MEPSLKMCPCCGGSASVRFHRTGRDYFDKTSPWIECHSCGLRTRKVHTSTKYLHESWGEVYNNAVDVLADAWNRRI